MNPNKYLPFLHLSEMEYYDKNLGFSKRKLLRRILSGISVLFLILQISFGSFLIPIKPAKAAGTTYYVANAGNDACDGKSQTIGSSGSCAWKTIAKVNASSFSSGDSILFNKGDTWREQLTVPSSGSAGSPITFGAYGSGTNPQIIGSVSANSAANWTNDPGTQEQGGIFVTGLENEVSNFTHDFTGEAVSSGNTLTLDTSTYNHGTTSMLSTMGGTNYQAYAYKTLTDIGDVYVRIYVLITSALQTTNYNDSWFMELKNGSTDAMYISMKKGSSGANDFKWDCIVARSGGTTVIYGGTDNEISYNTWYRVEMHYKSDASVGGGEVWIDGTSKGSNFTLNTSANTMNRLELGVTSRNNVALLNGAKVYIDDVKVDTSAIGAYVAGTTNLWYSSTLATPQIVWRDTAHMTLAASKSALASNASLTEWWWDSGNSRVYTYTGSGTTAPPDVGGTSNHTFEIPQRNNCVTGAASVDYITIDGLYCSYSNDVGINVDTGMNNWTVQNSTITRTYKTGLRFNTNSNASVISNTISYAGNMLDDGSVDPTTGPQTGLLFDTVSTGLIQGNTISYTGRTGICVLGNISNVIVERNEVSHAGQVGHHGYGIQLYSGTAKEQTGEIVRYNYLHDNNNIDLYLLNKVTSPQVYYNLFIGINSSDLITDWHGNIIFDNTTGIATDISSGGTFYNNVLYFPSGCTNNPYNIRTVGTLGRCESCLFKNNIFFNQTSGQKAYYSTYIHTVPPTFNYNQYYINSGTIVVYENVSYTLATFRSDKSQEISGASADPLFVSTSDFHLQSTSPAIDAGTNVGLTSDYAGVSVPRGLAPEIGAYEYPVPLAPTIGAPSALSFSSIRWNFIDNATDETGFRLYGSTGAILTQSPLTNLSYLDETGLSAGTQYSGRYVKAYNSYGESVASDVAISMTTSGVPGGGPMGLIGISPATANLSLPVAATPAQTAASPPPTIPSPAPTPQTNIPTTPITTPLFTKTLKYGSRGNQVTLLQDTLKYLGFFPQNIKSNGNFGPTTRQAVISYQKSKSIYASGILDSSTRKALNNQEYISNKSYQFTQDLKYNDKGEEVRQLQIRLRDLSFFPSSINPTLWFGPTTRKSVKLFQKQGGIAQTGIADGATREVLNR